MKRLMIVLALLTLLLTLYINHLVDFPIPDSKLYSSGNQIVNMHTAMDEQQLTTYRHMRVIDMIYPAVYGLFFSLFVYTMAKRLCVSNWPAARLPLFPAAAMLFDYLENILLMHALHNTAELVWSTQVAGWFTLVKWLLVSSTLIITIALIIRQLQLLIRARCIRCGP